jgi:hypothetical protein
MDTYVKPQWLTDLQTAQDIVHNIMGDLDYTGNSLERVGLDKLAQQIFNSANALDKALHLIIAGTSGVLDRNLASSQKITGSLFDLAMDRAEKSGQLPTDLVK